MSYLAKNVPSFSIFLSSKCSVSSVCSLNSAAKDSSDVSVFFLFLCFLILALLVEGLIWKSGKSELYKEWDFVVSLYFWNNFQLFIQNIKLSYHRCHLHLHHQFLILLPYFFPCVFAYYRPCLILISTFIQKMEEALISL